MFIRPSSKVSVTSVTRGGAADPPGAPVVVAEDDPERLLGVDAVADHPLVALLEDVERHQLARQDHRRQFEDRQLDDPLRLPCDGLYEAVGLGSGIRTVARRWPEWGRWRPTSRPRGCWTASTAKAREARAASCWPSSTQDGVTIEELRAAVEQDRLALLPVERLIAGDGPRLSAAEIAERRPASRPRCSGPAGRAGPARRSRRRRGRAVHGAATSRRRDGCGCCWTPGCPRRESSRRRGSSDWRCRRSPWPATP